MNLDRFAHGLPDDQEAPVLAYCAGCGGEIYPGEIICQMDQGELLHWEGRCLVSYFRPLTVWAEEVIETQKRDQTPTSQGDGRDE
ncbi:MAG: hypothetical protein HPY50_04975 [Firmicutes bacterium]|nr:hypothetical protein [Bacillota bacterium]